MGANYHILPDPNIKLVEYTFTIDQCLNLFSVPVEILPAPGVNRIINFLNIIGVSQFNPQGGNYYDKGDTMIFTIGNNTVGNLYGILSGSPVFYDPMDYYILGIKNANTPTDNTFLNTPLIVTGDADSNLGDRIITISIQYNIITFI